MKTTWLHATCFTLVAMVALGSAGSAQTVYFNELWDTSIRAAGMGGASAGVTWGDPNVWGNVATLATVEGARWEHGRTAYPLWDDNHVRFQSDRLLLGHGGLALGTAGVPVGLGSVRWIVGTTYQGRVFEAHTHRIPSIQLALSIPRAWATLGGRSAPGDAYDLSVGAAVEHSTEQTTPYWPGGGPPSTQRATKWNFGTQARWSPLRFSDPAALEGGVRGRLRLELGAGGGVLNAYGHQPDDELVRCYRFGASTRLAIAMPSVAGSGPVHEVLAGLPHLVSVGLAYDHELQKRSLANRTLGYRDLVGAEISLADVVVLRAGHVFDLIFGSTEVKGTSTGWGVGLPIGPWGGFRYDRARIPVPDSFDDSHLTRTGWTIWCDAMRVWRDLGPAGDGPVRNESRSER